MRTSTSCSDIISGKDLYDFKVRSHYESIMEPLIMEKLNLHLDLEPHVNGDDLKVCFYDVSRRVTLRVPCHLSFSVSQMLERIYKQSEEELLSIHEYITSSDYIMGKLTKLRYELNKK